MFSDTDGGWGNPDSEKLPTFEGTLAKQRGDSLPAVESNAASRATGFGPESPTNARRRRRHGLKGLRVPLYPVFLYRWGLTLWYITVKQEENKQCVLNRSCS